MAWVLLICEMYLISTGIALKEIVSVSSSTSYSPHIDLLSYLNGRLDYGRFEPMSAPMFMDVYHLHFVFLIENNQVDDIAFIIM